MENIKADRNAFDAYNILYYPLFGKGSVLGTIDTADMPSPNERDCAMALTVQENLSKTPYALSESSLTILAQVYAVLREKESVLIIDPYADIVSIVPESAPAVPMYPDFPTQVLNIAEEQFRADQLMHYISTYGVELMASFLFGTDVEVRRGWMPDVEETEKTREDDSLVDKHIVELIVSPDAMSSVIASDLSRPKRMPAAACVLAAELFAAKVLLETEVSFHENMMEILRASANISSSALDSACLAMAQHPGDIFKAVLWCAEKNEKNHIATKAKKGFCRALEAFDADDIAHNLADLSRKGERAANMLSIERFGGENLTSARKMLDDGSVRSYASVLEEKWNRFKSGEDVGAYELLAWYEKRSGIMLRSLARLIRNGVPVDAVEKACFAHVQDFSIATLIQIENAFSAIDVRIDRDWSGRAVNEADAKRREANSKISRDFAALVAKLLSARLRDIDTPMANKKVFVDPTGFSLVGSVVLPNETSNTSGAYPPNGMAYDVPSDKTVRFFTFWDEHRRRVDIDLHFQYTDTDGRRGSIGWNSSFRGNGMVTSGDITHSDNAAEYLDIDMKEALDAGIDTVFQRQHIYAGASNWGDIETCFSGALVVGDTKPDVALYNSKNILFHDDMDGDGREMLYAMVDVPNHYVRILRGTSLPFTRNAFTLASYLGLMLEAQESTVVETVEDADVVLSVGRAASSEIDGKPVVSLIDNGFFIQ